MQRLALEQKSFAAGLSLPILPEPSGDNASQSI
jgi:hypothetical protein